MTVQSTTWEPPSAVTLRDQAELEALVRADQLAGVRKSLAISIPVNALLSVATFAVAIRHGDFQPAAMWLAAASVANALRGAQCWLLWPSSTVASSTFQLRLASALACFSGLVWACTVLLPQSLFGLDAAFHLIVGAGITGGSIAFGFAYAPIALCFIIPILIANAVALACAGTVEHSYLSATIAIYLAALYHSTVQNERTFKAAARLKHEATALARSLRRAHGETLEVAEEMTHRAQHDSLTGLLNRAGFLRELERRVVNSSGPCCLMLLDLDGFKSINDAFGHKTGDLVLSMVATRLRDNLPEEAAAARLGGDEFAIALDPSLVGTPPTLLAERLIAAVGAPFGAFDAGRIGVGIGLYDGKASTAEEILVYADEALYAAKSAGRSQFYAFDDILRAKRETRRDIERDLPAAIEAGTIEVWFQPILGDGGQRLACVESLLRWHHPKHGWISPVDMLPAAALGGHSQRLFTFILDRACDMAMTLRTTGRGDVAVAVNVSPREMTQLAVDKILLTRLRAAGLPPGAIEIEITEEMAIDIDAVQDKLANLSAAGIRIAIDDFGVGYSSLSTLRRLHADRIKIDRCFVTGLSESSENRLLLQAVVSLGRAMNLDVVAEGVEGPEDVLTLRALGCQYMQGYHLGRPATATAFLASLSAGEAKATASAA